MRIAELDQLNYKRVFLAKKDIKKLQGKFNLELIGLTKAVELEKYF